MPTDYEEPKGLFVLEAMAAGVPVVQPRKGAFPELVETTGGGELVRAGDAEHLAATLDGLLRDADARKALGARAAEGVREHYSVENMAESCLRVFEKLIKHEPIGASERLAAGAATH